MLMRRAKVYSSSCSVV